MEDFLSSPSILTKVGQGFCGTVWSHSEAVVVIKRADGGPGRSLPNEHYIHGRILAAARTFRERENKGERDAGNGEHETHLNEDGDRIKVNIPSNLGFLEQTSTLWSKILPRLPQRFTACEALVSERIPPMSLAVRELLAGRYCPSSPDRALQLARDRANESCLVRPYLGRRRPRQGCSGGSAGGGGAPRQRFFSLRNFPLHVDQMEELGLPAAAYATAMADALAFLHWTARVDACDVEFVLAGPRPPSSPWFSSSSSSSSLSIGGAVDLSSSSAFGPHSIWILDFDCCRPLEMTGEGMRRAAMCFWRNDPFYPRPGSQVEEDRWMWDVFVVRFLESSARLLRDESDSVKMLPVMLIQTIRENRDTWTKGATD